MLARIIALVLAFFTSVSLAQSPTLPGFPPGVFQSRGALDANGSGTPCSSPSPTTVFSLSLGSTEPGWANSNSVQTILATGLSSASGQCVRLTIQVSALAAGTTVQGYFGQQGAGDPFDFTGTQVQLKWSGSTTLTGDGVTTVFPTDYVQLGEAYDKTKNHVMALFFSTGTATSVFAGGQTGYTTYFHAAPNDTATTDKSGYAADQNNAVTWINKIEISP